MVKDRVATGAYPDLTTFSTNIHLDDPGHRLVADMLHDELLPLVTAHLEGKK